MSMWLHCLYNDLASTWQLALNQLAVALRPFVTTLSVRDYHVWVRESDNWIDTAFSKNRGQDYNWDH